MKSEQLKREFAEDMFQIVYDYSCAADDKKTFIEKCNAKLEAVIAERMSTEEVVTDIKNILDNSVIKGIEDDGTLSYGFISTSDHYVIAQNIERKFRSRMGGSEK